MTNQPLRLSAVLLALGGILLSVMGLYFVLIRPPLLAEDLRYMQTTLPTIQEKIPGMIGWLSRVFTVLGGYIFTSGPPKHHFMLLTPASSIKSGCTLS